MRTTIKEAIQDNPKTFLAAPKCNGFVDKKQRRTAQRRVQENELKLKYTIVWEMPVK